MGKQQKPDPKNMVTIGRLKEIIAQNNYDKDKIEYLREALGTNMGDASPDDIKDQIRLDQIESQNLRYGNLIKKADKEAAAKKRLTPAPRKKTGMDALKAVGEYITTFGYAKEGYNPAPSRTKGGKEFKNTPKK